MSSLGELVAGISHEINTPLWYLMSNSAVVQERLTEVSSLLDVAESMVQAAKTRTSVKETVSAGLVSLNSMLSAGMKEDVDEATDLIQDSIEGLEELTELAQSLKDFSRLDRAKQGQFNVNEGLNKTLLIVKNKIKVNSTVHKHYGEVPDILCSPSQINQVFLNLIVNASDAIDKQGDIVLHTWEKDGKVGIRVADTGCGIPEDELTKVRDPFFTTKDVGEGTGLGLSIVNQIVTAHHGELLIESTVGKGTTITVELPIKPPAEAVEKAAVANDDAEEVKTATDENAKESVTEPERASDTNVVEEDGAEVDETAKDRAIEAKVVDAEDAAAEDVAATDENTTEDVTAAEETGPTDVTASDGNASAPEDNTSEDVAAHHEDVIAADDNAETDAVGEAENDDWAGDTNVFVETVVSEVSPVSGDAGETDAAEADAAEAGGGRVGHRYQCRRSGHFHAGGKDR